jgi:hypothetical protein
MQRSVAGSTGTEVLIGLSISRVTWVTGGFSASASGQYVGDRLAIPSDGRVAIVVARSFVEAFAPRSTRTSASIR